MSTGEHLFENKENTTNRHYIAHLGFYFSNMIKVFFSNPFKEERRDLNMLDTVKALLESETTDDNIKKCKELIKLHRIVENTRARKRLEKWSLRIIATYLFIVLSIVILNYIQIGKPLFHIHTEIMITILSTTTINIIGLGLIVLRGHFLADDKTNRLDDKD